MSPKRADAKGSFTSRQNSPLKIPHPLLPPPPGFYSQGHTWSPVPLRGISCCQGMYRHSLSSTEPPHPRTAHKGRVREGCRGGAQKPPRGRAAELITTLFAGGAPVVANHLITRTELFNPPRQRKEAVCVRMSFLLCRKECGIKACWCGALVLGSSRRKVFPSP